MMAKKPVRRTRKPRRKNVRRTRPKTPVAVRDLSKQDRANFNFHMEQVRTLEYSPDVTVADPLKSLNAAAKILRDARKK